MYCYLVVAIALDIVHVIPDRLAFAEGAFRPRKMLPDGLAQVRQVQPTKHPVPIRIVTLGPTDLAPCSRRITALPTQLGEGAHLLVHAVGFGILDQEVPPVSTPH